MPDYYELACDLQEDNVEVLILGTSECELLIFLFGSRVVAGVSKMRSYWSGVGP